jgi:hypothetical protein
VSLVEEVGAVIECGRIGCGCDGEHIDGVPMRRHLTRKRLHAAVSNWPNNRNECVDARERSQWIRRP